MARYRYEALTPTEFEGLVLEICQALLGEGTRGFSEGPDGGRDARFDGVANGYPSRFAPWKGTTIIQAKHTNRTDASFSDADFSGSSGTLSKEIPSIKKLVEQHKLDHYMLFANRRLSGRTDDEIISRISKECGIDVSDIHVCGVEELDQFLAKHKEIAERRSLGMLTIPLPLTRDNLVEVIEGVNKALILPNKPGKDEPVSRTSLERKNVLNGVSEEDIKPLRKLYLKDSAEIDRFLASPINQDLLEKYVEATSELNERLPHLKKLHGDFMGAYYAVNDILLGDASLAKHRRLVKSVLFYMYWHCDFGRSEADDDDTA